MVMASASCRSMICCTAAWDRTASWKAVSLRSVTWRAWERTDLANRFISGVSFVSSKSVLNWSAGTPRMARPKKGSVVSASCWNWPATRSRRLWDIRVIAWTARRPRSSASQFSMEWMYCTRGAVRKYSGGAWWFAPTG